MIDRVSRDRLVELLQELMAGEISSGEFHKQRPQSQDLAVREVNEQAWLLCRDLPEPKTSGRKKLLREARGEVSRWILFLQTDAEYQWPVLPIWARVLGFIPSVISFGLFWAPYRAWFKRRGDYQSWPFLEEKELRAAQARKPRG